MSAPGPSPSRSSSGGPTWGDPTPGRPTPGRPTPGRPTPGRPTLGRRRFLALAATGAAALAASPVLAACTSTDGTEGPDPLIALARRARADAALVGAAIAADPRLTDRLDPLRAARTDHATALDREIQRLNPKAAPSAAPATAPPKADLAAVRTAVQDASREAQGLVAGIAVERVGLVAAITACCTTYAAVLA
ncbi:MAG: hypothetical protein OJJ54_14560 [Pseudonocardia sp.]|nr:hypothetical protein [Pseudonocardia sp.]